MSLTADLCLYDLDWDSSSDFECTLRSEKTFEYVLKYDGVCSS